VLVRAFVPDKVGALSTAADDDLLAAVQGHVGSVLGARTAPTATWVHRWRQVMPKYTVGHLARVMTVDQALEPSTWRVAGSALHGVGVPDCIADGRAQAKAALAAITVTTEPRITT
jgi:oxygen-dependent protoporphyrinogen oxidase